MEKGQFTGYVEEKARVNDSQIIHESLVIIGSRLRRNNAFLIGI